MPPPPAPAAARAPSIRTRKGSGAEAGPAPVIPPQFSTRGEAFLVVGTVICVLASTPARWESLSGSAVPPRSPLRCVGSRCFPSDGSSRLGADRIAVHRSKKNRKTLPSLHEHLEEALNPIKLSGTLLHEKPHPRGREHTLFGGKDVFS